MIALSAIGKKHKGKVMNEQTIDVRLKIIGWNDKNVRVEFPSGKQLWLMKETLPEAKEPKPEPPVEPWMEAAVKTLGKSLDLLPMGLRTTRAAVAEAYAVSGIPQRLAELERQLAACKACIGIADNETIVSGTAGKDGVGGSVLIDKLGGVRSRVSPSSSEAMQLTRELIEVEAWAEGMAEAIGKLPRTEYSDELSKVMRACHAAAEAKP